ncbi:tRNA (adenosine(37)-N6)-threonylcarbamoyltransferase complex ATPase subunit type 1 TsaE [Bacillus sp. FSL K6-2971]|uniref:tRNA (adenosine(37)-N6)-threonylcarbamoyltransferase complex ATPase subunit type 1 TsaE n=1 Tax=Bacillus sp. FSL K6-2971 TaxID=2921487 RepID=UPI004046E428
MDIIILRNEVTSTVKLTWTTKGADETKRIAAALAKLVMPGDVLTLEGDLGAGKTTFSKGFAEGLGITRIVNSPTFTIIKEYTDGRLPLYHMDVYRMEDAEEDIGLEEYFEGEGVCLVEWAHLIGPQLPSSYLKIEMLRTEREEERHLTFSAKGDRYETLCKEMKEFDHTGN